MNVVGIRNPNKEMLFPCVQGDQRGTLMQDSQNLGQILQITGPVPKYIIERSEESWYSLYASRGVDPRNSSREIYTRHRHFSLPCHTAVGEIPGKGPNGPYFYDNMNLRDISPNLSDVPGFKKFNNINIAGNSTNMARLISNNLAWSKKKLDTNRDYKGQPGGNHNPMIRDYFSLSSAGRRDPNYNYPFKNVFEDHQREKANFQAQQQLAKNSGKPPPTQIQPLPPQVASECQEKLFLRKKPLFILERKQRKLSIPLHLVEDLSSS